MSNQDGITPDQVEISDEEIVTVLSNGGFVYLQEIWDTLIETNIMFNCFNHNPNYQQAIAAVCEDTRSGTLLFIDNYISKILTEELEIDEFYNELVEWREKFNGLKVFNEILGRDNV